MPWLETNPVLERRHFIQDYESGHWAMTELCLRYNISRNTGYKWLDRYRQSGGSGLHDHSRAPHTSPHRTPDELVALILDENARYGWGARKILKRLKTRFPNRALPARSTVFDILERHGRVRPRRRRRRWKHPGAAPFNTTAPNQVWTVDFKGQFLMRNGRYCYPLTIVDHFSRYLLCCHGLHDVKTPGVKRQFQRLFHEHGLPDAIRSDNGAPFASTGIHGLTNLNVWWLQLGITHQRITPGNPQQNGAHERMHRTLKARATKPPGADLSVQQRLFKRFRKTYNDSCLPVETLKSTLSSTNRSTRLPSSPRGPTRQQLRNLSTPLHPAVSVSSAQRRVRRTRTSRRWYLEYSLLRHAARTFR